MGHPYLQALVMLCAFQSSLPIRPSGDGRHQEFVTLHTPTNLTLLMLVETEAYIFWYEPQNYHVHRESSAKDDEHPSRVPEHQAKVERPANTTTANPKVLQVNSTSGMSTKLPNRISDADDGATGIFVPYHQGQVENYIVHYYASNTTEGNSVAVAAGETGVWLRNLTRSTLYYVLVFANYTSGDVVGSARISFRTKENEEEGECHCSFQGTLANQTCNQSVERWCECKTGYKGLFCEDCQPNYYRLNPGSPCTKCPCTLKSSSGTCTVYESRISCDACKRGYRGDNCSLCDNGYFYYYSMCERCFCHSNVNTSLEEICAPESGACKNCMYNTTGFTCERCLPGYVGDPIVYKNCTLRANISTSTPSFHKSATAVTVVCITLALIVCFLVGFFLYRHWKVYPRMKPFWTVELKQDQDSVNFSAVPDHEFHAIDNSDMDFYEKQSSRHGSSRYSPLKERF